MQVSEGMWASIESQIPLKKEKPKYWLLFLLLGFLIPIGLYTKISSTDNTAKSKVAVEHHSTESSLAKEINNNHQRNSCLLYTSPSPRDS